MTETRARDAQCVGRGVRERAPLPSTESTGDRHDGNRAEAAHGTRVHRQPGPG